MEQSYQVGSGNAQITLNVTVGTVGVAYSEFSIMKNFKIIGSGKSKPRSGGKIDNAVLGETSYLQGTILTIDVLIDLSHLNQAQRESAINNLVVAYELLGGKDGNKKYSFNKETDLMITPNQKILAITTQIALI